MPGRCGGCPMPPLDCRVATLLAMTTVGSGGRGGFGSGFRAYPLCCHWEPCRGCQSGLLTVMSLRGRSRRELTWQSSLRRDSGCPGRCGGMPGGSAGLPRQADAFLAMTTQKHGDAQTVAGLPRRCAPRNDKGGSGGRGGGMPDGSAGLPRQADAFLAMTTQKHGGCSNGRGIAASGLCPFSQ
jgi:hypothetical protein